MKYLTFICFLGLLTISADFAAADAFDCLSELGPKDRASLLSDIEAQYQRISDLEAEFLQHSYFVGLDERKSSQGKVYFKKPGMMDWDYISPEKQRFVADGSTLWYFQPELNQVTIGAFKASFSSDLPVAFLLGVGELRQNFTLDSACRSDEGVVAKLLPKKAEANLDRFYLLVEPKSHAPKGARILDVGGNETTILFLKVVLNQGILGERFTFTIPRGVDIIDSRDQNVDDKGAVVGMK